MNFRKNSKTKSESVTHYAQTDSAITLIALVITIIVLLILAGVSINLISGSDGILEKAENAVVETNISKIEEEIELAMVELKIQYYEDNETEKFGQYAEIKLKSKDAKGNLMGITTSNGRLVLDGDVIKYIPKGAEKETSKGAFDKETGSITIFGKTFSRRITTANYGEYVDLETTILSRTDGVITQKLGGENPTEQPLTDWRIFHEDENGGIYLILADYLQYDENLGTGLTQYEYETKYEYGWKSDNSRMDLIDRLNGTSTDYQGVNPWNKLIGDKYTNEGVSVTGAPDIEIHYIFHIL